MGLIIFQFLLFTLYIIKYLECIPVNSVISSEYEFEDEWNYQISPHREPLLNGTTKNHILPEIKIVERETIPIPQSIRVSKTLGDAVKSKVSCSLCKLGVGLLVKEIRNNSTFVELKGKFVSLCVTFKVETESVCSGIFDVYGPEVVAVMKKVQIGPPEICSLIFGESCGNIENPIHQWTIELPDIPKPEIIESELPKDGLPTFKVLHLSDTHFDPHYMVGSVSNCQEPLCCRADSTPSDTEQVIPAGKWGAYAKCDSPRVIIINMLENIAREHPDIDYIIWTGDLPPHDIWKQTKEGNLDIITEAVTQMFEIFPTTPIFPALGNHESIPPGSYPPPWVKEDHSISWLYTQIADHWRKWLPASVGNTVLHGGFYSVLIRPGFRLISLNMNYCYTISWWLLLNSTDPAKELKWLVYELQEAENKGEKVHIIGHIPPGSSDCMKIWSYNFYKIINRYENTVKAQFYGHTHADEFEVFYDLPELSRATNIAYIGPSVTTFDNFNPAYRIYYVDGEHNSSTHEVIDHETWTINLDEANANEFEDPHWYRLYNARNAYNMNSLRPSEWANLIERMVVDKDLFDLFYKNYFRDNPSRPPCDDSKCKLQILCDLKSGKSHERHYLCHDLELAVGR